jgi:hypothetical protein
LRRPAWRALASPLLYAGTAAIALIGGIVGLRLWEGRLDVPLDYAGDTLQFLAWTKGISEHGWLMENPGLGAPFGLELYDFPEGGFANLLAFPVLATLSGSWVVAFNQLHLLTFPLAAVGALWALRRLRVAWPIAGALAVLYATAPYHLDRGPQHYLLSFYWALPPLLSYAVTAAAGQRPVTWPRRGGWKRWLRRSAPALVAAVLVGLMQIYYVAFAAMLVLAAGLFGWLRSRRPAVLTGALVLCTVITLAAMLQYAPSLGYRGASGVNRDVASRGVGEAEYFPLKLADLVLPVSDHVVRPLAELREQYQAIGTYAADRNALGIIGTIGLLASLAALVGAAAARRRGALLRRLSPFGWLAVTGIGLAMFGGGSTLFSLFVGPSLRAWDRLSILIAFLALSAAGLLLTHVARRMHGGWRSPALVAVGALVLLVGLVDQVGTRTWRPDYEATAARWQADKAYVARVDGLLPPDGLVYQLPYLPWPERTRGGIVSNEQMRPYLHSEDLRWSGAAMTGRNPGWLAIANGGGADEVIQLLQAIGADAIQVDHRLLEGEKATSPSVALIDGLAARLGPAAVASDDHAWRLYLLPAGSPSGQMRDDALDPVWLRWARGFEVLSTNRGRISHPAASEATVELRNNRPHERQVTAQLWLVPEHGDEQVIQLHWPDGHVDELRILDQPVLHRRELTLAAGVSELRLMAVDAPGRAAAYNLADLTWSMPVWPTFWATSGSPSG